ncbi:MAG: SusC/RagA family TonB-linked outer membrane protein [Prevotellaceae bacterium]|nr:SusC/RagA family TonB-linked outer membrane protein [Prevotellaceae bacterium]
MEKRIKLLLACLFLFVGMAMAQTKVTGTVVSQENGEPVIGAAVKILGTNQGTVTDVNGKFTISVPAGKKLRVSFVGLETVDVSASNGMKIVLKQDAKTLDEVVVTAMGIKRSAKALGYSATAVDGDKIAAARTNDVMSSLAGKVAGVSISSTSSDPGASNAVIIRGVSSLSGNNQPLYVIDGVPLTNASVSSGDQLNNGYDFGNGANAVNPDDVESMTILKGAAATALYGSRAASGVILITTKSGKKQKKGIGIEYNGGLQMESVLRLPQMQNEFGMGWYGEKTDTENGSWGPAFDGSTLKYGNVYENSQNLKSYLPIENNVKDFFDTGLRYNNSVSFNGATDQSNFFVSLSQIHDDGIIPTDADSYTKYTFSGRASHKIKNVTLSASMNYAYQKNSFVSTGQKAGSMYNCIMQTPRDISIAEMKDLSNPFNTPGYYYTPYGVTNPYYILNNYQNEYEQERFYGKFQLDWDIFKDLKFTYRFGLDTTTGHHDSGEPNLSALFAGTPNWEDALKSLTGEVYQRTERRREIDQNLMLNYSHKFFDKLDVNATLGLNGNERRYKYFSADVTNLTIPTYFNLTNSSEKPTVAQYESLRRLIGVYGQVELGYDDWAYITLTARNDWSSTLPKGNRSFFYPGITGSFIFTKFLNPDLKKYITFGKARIAWGKTGNDAAPYMTNSVFAQGSASTSGWGSSSFPFSKGNYNAYSVGNTLGSNNLSPEMTTEIEFGLNMAFFENRFSFDISYYNRNTDKQIFSLEMDPASGYTAQNMNLGKIRNRGIEAMVSVTPVRTRDFEWTLTWNYTRNRSKVISLPEELGGESLIWGLSGGTGLYAIVGEELGVFKAYTAEHDPDGNVIVDASGLPKKSTEQTIVGSMNSKYQMGIGNTISYKGVSLSFDFDFRKGGVMYSRTKDINYFVGNAIQTAYNDRNPWIIPNSVVDNGDGTYSENTVALTPTNIYNYWNNGDLGYDSSFLVDKSYIKLRQVVLAWDLPKAWLANTFLTGVKVSLYGNNLLMWTPSGNTFMDPESSSFGNDLEGNFGEWSTNPSSRKYGFNVSLKF